MEEEITFKHKLYFPCTKCTENLENYIYERISSEEFFTKKFDVLNVIRFDIKDMSLVTSTLICCKLVVTAICNNPSIGKTFTVTSNECKIFNNRIIFSLGRIQIICPISEEEKFNLSFTICITGCKIVSKNILCIAELCDFYSKL